MLITPSIARRRNNMHLFIEEYRRCMVGGQTYRRVVDYQGTAAAHALQEKARQTLERNAKKALTDLYGNPLEITHL